MKRILFFIIMLFSLVFAYWWITWCLAIILLFYFPVYFEIIALGIVYDALYGLTLPEFWNIKYIFTLASIVLFLISLIIKKRLIIYE